MSRRYAQGEFFPFDPIPESEGRNFTSLLNDAENDVSSAGKFQSTMAT
jgi:hypothetical protein